MTIMKSVLAAACLALLAPDVALAQTCVGTPSSARLKIVIDIVHSDKGLMTASLYGGDGSGWLKSNGALKVWRDSAQAGVQTMCIFLPGPGPYAVAVYHDANGNKKLDIGGLGPTEAYGFSNNPRILFAPPSYAKSKFEAKDGETTVHVRLHHPGGA